MHYGSSQGKDNLFKLSIYSNYVMNGKSLSQFDIADVV